MLLIFLIHLLNVYSQEVDYRNYYKTINRAELKIVDSLYNDALTIYDSAFSIVAKPFGKDFHNAALLAIIVGNDDKCDTRLSR